MIDLMYLMLIFRSSWLRLFPITRNKDYNLLQGAMLVKDLLVELEGSERTSMKWEWILENFQEDSYFKWRSSIICLVLLKWINDGLLVEFRSKMRSAEIFRLITQFGILWAEFTMCRYLNKSKIHIAQ